MANIKCQSPFPNCLASALHSFINESIKTIKTIPASCMLYFFPSDPGSLNLTPSHFVGYVGLNPTFRCIYTGDLLSTITISWLVNDIPIERYALQAIKFALQDTVGGLVIQNIPASWNNSYILCSAHAHEGLSVNSSLSSIKLQGNNFLLFAPRMVHIMWEN